jgi:hypothetical protein
MTLFLRIRTALVAGAALLALLALLSGTARGQAGLIGSQGGVTVPVVPTTVPVLPPGLNLPPQVASSLVNGLDASGTALRPGMGWLVNDAAQQGVQGQQLADVIHQLKPYKQRGVLTFPQNTVPQNPVPPVGPVPGPTAQQPGRLVPVPQSQDGDDGHGHEHGHGWHIFGKRWGGKGGKDN